MTTAIRISDPVDLIESLPSILGFTPSASLILVAMKDKALVFTARIDMDGFTGQVADGTVAVLHGKADSVIVLAVDPHSAKAVGAALKLADAARKVGVDVQATHIVADYEVGTPVYSATDHGLRAVGRMTGKVTTLHAAHVVSGRVVHESREALMDTLHGNTEFTRDVGADPEFGSVTDLAKAVCKGNLDEPTLRKLAGALSNVQARDALLCTALEPEAFNSWGTVARNTAGEARANALVILGAHLWHRGEGVWAREAMRLALEERPDNRMAGLFAAALDGGLPSTTLTSLFRTSRAMLDEFTKQEAAS